MIISLKSVSKPRAAGLLLLAIGVIICCIGFMRARMSGQVPKSVSISGRGVWAYDIVLPQSDEKVKYSVAVESRSPSDSAAAGRPQAAPGTTRPGSAMGSVIVQPFTRPGAQTDSEHLNIIIQAFDNSSPVFERHAAVSQAIVLLQVEVGGYSESSEGAHAGQWWLTGNIPLDKIPGSHLVAVELCDVNANWSDGSLPLLVLTTELDGRQLRSTIVLHKKVLQR